MKRSRSRKRRSTVTSELPPPRPDAARDHETFFALVYTAVRSIPRGSVASYGQIAVLVGVPRGARAVGWALRALRGQEASRVPWHRVIGASGRISPRGGTGPIEQRRRLEAEGVRFVNGRVQTRLTRGSRRISRAR